MLSNIKKLFTKKATGADGFMFALGDKVVAQINSPLEGDPKVFVPATISRLDVHKYSTDLEITDHNGTSMNVCHIYIHDPEKKKADTASIPPSYPAKAGMFAAIGTIPKNLRKPETNFEPLKN